MQTQIYPKPAGGFKLPSTAFMIGGAIVAAAIIYYLITKPKKSKTYGADEEN